MTLLYYDPLFLEHHTGDHPENAGRLPPVVERLQKLGLTQRCLQPEWTAATVEQLAYVHPLEYIQQIEEFAARGGGRIEADTMLSARSYEVAKRVAGAVADAVRKVVEGPQTNAFCLVRPPGHHALANRPMGFCLFNNIALGARVAQRELQIERVMIVDFDVHHGNGTQDLFWTDGSVSFLSMHRYPFYPGSGAAEETGAGEGLGATRNLPIRMGTPPLEQLQRFRQELGEFADKQRPQLVLLSAGFDSHREDPIGSLGLESQDFRELTKAVLDVAQTHASGRLISVLEGGYNPQALAESVSIHVEELLNG